MIISASLLSIGSTNIVVPKVGQVYMMRAADLPRARTEIHRPMEYPFLLVVVRVTDEDSLVVPVDVAGKAAPPQDLALGGDYTARLGMTVWVRNSWLWKSAIVATLEAGEVEVVLVGLDRYNSNESFELVLEDTEEYWAWQDVVLGVIRRIEQEQEDGLS